MWPPLLNYAAYPRESWHRTSASIAVALTGGNRHDVTQPVPLLDAAPPIVPGPVRSPQSVPHLHHVEAPEWEHEVARRVGRMRVRGNAQAPAGWTWSRQWLISPSLTW
ncbi:hypothetical protein GCM10010440_50380 [Kitasatospora cinereorecta]